MAKGVGRGYVVQSPEAVLRVLGCMLGAVRGMKVFK